MPRRSQYQVERQHVHHGWRLVQRFQTTEGCDSTVTCIWPSTVPKTSGSVRRSANSMERQHVHQEWWLMQHFPTTEGCDSYPINYPKTSEFSATACSQYQWNDSTYTRATTMQSFQDNGGCDSTVTPSDHQLPWTSGVQCDCLRQYQWNDSTYTTSGDYSSTSLTTEAATAPSPRIWPSTT